MNPKAVCALIGPCTWNALQLPPDDQRMRLTTFDDGRDDIRCRIAEPAAAGGREASLSSKRRAISAVSRYFPSRRSCIVFALGDREEHTMIDPPRVVGRRKSLPDEEPCGIVSARRARAGADDSVHVFATFPLLPEAPALVMLGSRRTSTGAHFSFPSAAAPARPRNRVMRGPAK
jgi:hypothetical protein